MAQRDEAIEAIKAMGRKEWKLKEGYHHRSKAETAMFRYKTIIGTNWLPEKRHIKRQRWLSDAKYSTSCCKQQNHKARR